MNHILLSMGLSILLFTTQIGGVSVRFYSVEDPLNGTVQLLAIPTETVLSIGISDLDGHPHEMALRPNGQWRITLPLNTAVPRRYLVPVTIKTVLETVTQSISIHVPEMTPETLAMLAKIDDGVFDIKLQLKTRWAKPHVYPISKNHQLIASQLISLYQEESYLLNREWGDYLMQKKEPLMDQRLPLAQTRDELAKIESDIETIRSMILLQQALISALKYPETPAKKTNSKTAPLTVAKLYQAYYSKKYESTLVDPSQTILDIKIQSQTLFEKKLTLLKRRDVLMQKIAEDLSLYPKMRRQKDYNSRKSDPLTFEPLDNWRLPGPILNALNSYISELRTATRSPLPPEIESWRLYILDLKNGRADFRDYWPPTTDATFPTQTLQELDYQIQVTLLSLNQLLSQEGLDQLDSQKKTMDQVIQHQENKNQLFQTLLDELNEGVKKKIFQVIDSSDSNGPTH